MINRPARPDVRLTDLERDLLWSVSQGMTYREIAAQRFRHPQTLRSEGSRILAKLGARSMAQAVSVALLDGLIGRYEDCGSHAVYQRHRRRGEAQDACCLAAKADHDRVQRAAVSTRKKES